MSWTGIDRPEARSDTGFLPDDGDPGEVLTVGDDGRLEWADPGEAATAASVETIAELRLLPPVGGAVNVLGYYAPGDGGGGQFHFDDFSNAAENGGTVIVPADGIGRWLRLYSGPLSIRCFGARGDQSNAVGNTTAFNTAIAFFAQGGTILVPRGDYRIVGGLAWGNSIASMIGEGRYSIIQCTAQTGPVIDISISSLTSNFQYSQEIAHLSIYGDYVADPTKTHCGIRLHGSVTCLSFHHLIIGGTGGPCIKLETESDCCSFENISLDPPVSGFANNVPWVHLYGVANGNIFKNIILREWTNELSGVGGCIRLEMDPNAIGPSQPYSPASNKFIACQSEYIHIPEGGSVVHCDGRCNDFDHFVDYDSNTLTPTTNTCIIRFPANATFPFGGNMVRGFIIGAFGVPSYPTRGVIISSNGNHVDGVGGGYPNCVLLTVGATRNYVCLAGTGHPSIFTNLVVDNSAALNAIINTAEEGDFQVNKLRVGTHFYPTVPAVVSGVDSPTSAVVASFLGTAAGAFLHFTDRTIVNWGFGVAPTTAWLSVYANKSPGIAGGQMAAFTGNGNFLVGCSVDIGGTNGLGVLNNIEVVTGGKGLILLSPNGALRRLISIDNAGTLVLTPI